MKCLLQIATLLLFLPLALTVPVSREPVPVLREPVPPPPHQDLVGSARWMVKFSNVSILATQSSFLDGFPFGQNKDVADGLWNETLSTGE